MQKYLFASIKSEHVKRMLNFIKLQIIFEDINLISFFDKKINLKGQLILNSLTN